MVSSRVLQTLEVLLICFSASVTASSMHAAVATGAGKTEGDFSTVKIMDRPLPTPGHGQVRIRVAASSVNPVDWKLLSSSIMKLMTLSGPKVLGFDVSGTIDALGPGCDRLRVGDEVWADLGKSSLLHPVQLGAWAQYALADESQVGLKPSRLTFKEAGVLPLAALTDYQALKKAGAPWSDRRNLTVVVVSGAGGTGIPAIQLARAYGAARVVTAASASNAELLRRLGATDVIDYHKTSIWTELPQDSVDIVYDNYGAPGTADAAMPSIRTGGVFIYLPGKGGSLSRHPKRGVQQIDYGLCDSSHYQDLDALKVIAEAGNLTAVVQQSFGLDEVVVALNRSRAAHTVGKIAIEIGTPSAADDMMDTVVV